MRRNGYIECVLVDSVSNAPAFVVHHKERLVSTVIELWNVNRPAEHKTELVLAQLGLGRLQWRFCVKSIIPEKFEGCSVELVRTAFAHDVDLIRTEAVFR